MAYGSVKAVSTPRKKKLKIVQKNSRGDTKRERQDIRKASKRERQDNRASSRRERQDNRESSKRRRQDLRRGDTPKPTAREERSQTGRPDTPTQFRKRTPMGEKGINEALKPSISGKALSDMLKNLR